MNTKRATRLFGGVAAASAAGAVLLAVSGVALGLESPSLAALPASSGQPGDATIQVAQAATPPKVATYSDEQADRGKKKYESECVECHGDDLNGGLLGGPPLRGSRFDQNFAGGLPASGLFSYMSTLMPPNDPGRFSANEYADMMAYILKRNGFQPGAPLPSDLEALDNLILEK